MSSNVDGPYTIKLPKILYQEHDLHRPLRTGVGVEDNSSVPRDNGTRVTTDDWTGPTQTGLPWVRIRPVVGSLLHRLSPSVPLGWSTREPLSLRTYVPLMTVYR